MGVTWDTRLSQDINLHVPPPSPYTLEFSRLCVYMTSRVSRHWTGFPLPGLPHAHAQGVKGLSDWFCQSFCLSPSVTIKTAKSPDLNIRAVGISFLVMVKKKTCFLFASRRLIVAKSNTNRSFFCLPHLLTTPTNTIHCYYNIPTGNGIWRMGVGRDKCGVAASGVPSERLYFRIDSNDEEPSEFLLPI